MIFATSLSPVCSDIARLTICSGNVSHVAYNLKTYYFQICLSNIADDLSHERDGSSVIFHLNKEVLLINE